VQVPVLAVMVMLMLTVVGARLDRL
jgi:hypothetical protein